MWSVALAIDYQLGHNHRMVGHLSKGADPPFGRSQMWSVHRERLIFWIPGCRCLKTAHIRSMSKFCLRIAADIFIVLRFLKEELVLFRCTLLA